MRRSRPARDDAIEQIESAAREIEHYLDAHPHASDTLQGVHDWWLTQLPARPAPGVVLAALDRLIALQRVAARVIPGGVVYERARRARTADGL